MELDRELMSDLMAAVRVKNTNAKTEIEDLIEACKIQLRIGGVYEPKGDDPLYKQAIKLYCKAYYGYDKDSEKFAAAFAALRDSMALSGDYEKGGGPGG